MAQSIFIDTYLDWFLNSTDAPHIFGESSALMCLSTAALGKRWLRGADKVNPNLYLALVGPSSRARKSTSIKRSREIVEAVIPNRIGPTDYTAEGLFKWMQEKDATTGKSRTRLTLFGSEFSADLARSKGYKNSFRDDITNLYDGFDIEKTRSGFGKNVTILAPRVSLFAAITYEGLKDNTTGTDWQTGFLMRFLYVTPDAWRELRVVPAPEDPLRKQAAIDAFGTLWDMLDCNNPMGLVLSPAATQMYATAYLAHMRQIEQSKTDDREQPHEIYMQRFWPNVRKLALLFQLDMDPFVDVSDVAMDRALTFAANCWEGYRRAHRETTNGDFGTLANIVIETITAAGPTGVPIGQLWKTCGTHSVQLSNVIKYLETTNIVQKRVDPMKTVWFSIR
jgi:hypothetical protein